MTAPLTDAEIRDGIAHVARAHLGFEGTVEDDTPLIEALRLDSVRLLTLVAEVENHFRVMLEDGDEAGIETVGDLVTVIRRRMT
ncbi:MAG: acyl carrier protein [Pseudomonadota bacterium]|nr:acyl carrier protein [Pseudomonadota bacterium]